MLDAQNLSFAYKASSPDAILALRDITLRVAPGELVALIGASGTAHEVAATHRGHQHGGVGGHQAQALPTRHQASRIGTGQEPVVEPRQRRRVQAGAGLAKGAVGDRTDQRTIAAESAEEGVQQALLGRRAHAQQHGHQGWQRQQTGAGEGVRVVGMSRPLRESVRAEGIGQVQQEMLDVFTVLRPPCGKTSKNQKNQQLSVTSATSGASFTFAANLTAIHAGGLTPQAVALMHSAAAAPTTRKWRTAYHRKNAKNRIICLI